MDQIINLAQKIVTKATRANPADALLRTELRASKLPRAETRRVAGLVFAYYRWIQWLDETQSVPDQLQHARALDDRFSAEPQSFTDDELQRAAPPWLAGEMTVSPTLLRSLQTAPSLWIRARKGAGATLARRLGHAGPWAPPGWPPGETCSALPDCLRYSGREDLFRSAEFQAGEFEIQDVASQIIGLLCDPKPGETWWDACAGEGGKMLHLSDLMENKGLIWATDPAEWRLKRLRQRAARAKAFNYRAARWSVGSKLPTRTLFDGVLIDAPCSGVGTWQRNTQARWTTDLRDVKELAAIQQQLILSCAAALKRGGKLIYAVCTLTQTETDAVSDFCSQRLTGFESLPLPALPNGQQATSTRKRILPQDFGGNGMFLSAWQRVAS